VYFIISNKLSEINKNRVSILPFDVVYLRLLVLQAIPPHPALSKGEGSKKERS